MRNEIRKKRSSLLLPLIFMFSAWFSGSAIASNYVTVATIGGVPENLDVSKGMQFMVDQVKIYWQNELNQVIPYKPDLIVLPEACDRPGGLPEEKQFEYFRVRNNQILNLFASIAKENHCYILFGTKRQENNGIWRNSGILLDRQGRIAGIYNKNYPTIDEMKHITPSDDAPVFQCDFGKVAVAICYDLNFTELCDRFAAQKPDIILFPSMYHGGLMESYWAYRCRSFFVGADGFKTTPSEILNPLGQVVASSTNYFDFTAVTINLDREMVHLDNNWDKLTKLKEKYGREVNITDPGRLGPVLITSESKSVSAEEMTREFNIELLDSYFDRSVKIRDQNKR